MKSVQWFMAMVVCAAPVAQSGAQGNASDIAELRRLVSEMQADYEARISDLERRLARAELQANRAQRGVDDAIEFAEQLAIDQSSGVSAPNTFNPSIGAILSGRYADIDRGWEQLPGFQSGGETGPGGSGFSAGEAEINLKANVDNRYFGNLTIGVEEDDGEVEVGFEEAWLQTTSLPAGLTVTGGRFFSAAGYLNGFHFHADDFVDRPLPYQAFLGGRYSVDGVQARWILPSRLLVEFGAEVNWGGGFPATANGRSSPGAWTLFGKIGGDVGDSHSWQAGLSRSSADVAERGAADSSPAMFTGDSDLTIVDFVWKWAPQGNPARRNLKFQGEYFRRSETGLFDFIAYDGEQSGWYTQGLWQFAPAWRIGLRHDAVDADNGAFLAGTELEDPGRAAYRNSVMFDWSPSEFSRLRMQYIDDKVLPEGDQQWYLQYIMSIGAHGAHQF